MPRTRLGLAWRASCNKLFRMFSRRLRSWLVLSALIGLGACGLNPQPDLPGGSPGPSSGVEQPGDGTGGQKENGSSAGGATVPVLGGGTATAGSAAQGTGGNANDAAAGAAGVATEPSEGGQGAGGRGNASDAGAGGA